MLNKILCSINIHKYIYHVWKLKLKGHDLFKHHEVYVRECAHCKKKWRKVIPPPIGIGRKRWEPTDLTEDTVLEIVK